MEQNSSADGPTRRGPSVASAVFQQGSGACAGRSGAVLDTGATANPARFLSLRTHNDLLRHIPR